jgi:hypothetical protein
VMRVTTPTPPLVTPGGIALSDFEKADALADSLEAQFQPVADPLDPAVIETVDVVLRAYSYAPASEPMLTDTAEVQHAIRGLKISKAPGSDGIPNRTSTIFPSGFPSTGGAFQRDPQNAVFSSSMEACSSHLLSETGEAPCSTLFLSAHKFSRHDWQGF